MPKQDILFVINPNSGTDRKKNTLEKSISTHLAAEKFTPIIEYTKRPLHAKEIVQYYVEKGIKEIVAVGGDGTINEIASQLIGTDVILNLISKGSGNGLARHLGIFENEKACIERINKGEVTEIDTGLINNIPFLCTAGLGFDAYGAEKFGQMEGRGLKNYIRAGLSSYFQYKPLIIELEGVSHKVFSVTFGNASQFGNDAFITPSASITDGLLDCCIVKEHPKSAVFGLTQKLFNRKIETSKYVEYHRAKSFLLKAEEPVLIHYDGEPMQLESTEIKVEIRPKSLKIKI
ncbi:diacylglycerol/lipid kinase family protein [Arcticibacterium luteifluviistationis]|uniref:diacylglycerol/lipid kinase family protein n=1 Tax=Arcticibacterium luteifluviistationis TaxID=1784714 RepID=UPI0013A6E47C|nr:diacylglycerol kinase family protein [Arcticibacterium luteifluviistationis]